LLSSSPERGEGRRKRKEEGEGGRKKKKKIYLM